MIRTGDRVTWNDVGRRMFGDTGSVGLVTWIGCTGGGTEADSAHVLWESGQDTYATLNVLEVVR